MELYEMECEKALRVLAAHGREPDDFTIERSFLPPDPDGGGMFTVQYEVIVTNQRTDKAIGAIGGIGFDWVAVFADALDEGLLD
jgi:hypothetical protein